MAGIGFAIRKLTDRGDLTGLAAGYAHAAFAASGAWVFTILTLAGLTLVGPRVGSYDDVVTFRLIVVYNFAFSLVFTGPIALVATRYLSDRLFVREVDGIPGTLLGCLALTYATQLPLAAGFYLGYAELDRATAIGAVLCYLLVAGTWVVGVFLSTLKEFAAISRIFAAGMLVAFVSALGLAGRYGAAGMMAGFTAGVGLVHFLLVARVLAEFPFRAVRPFAFLGHFRSHWELAAGGAVYYAAIWVDKWVMWGAPEREWLPSGLVSYPDYDSAMFLACLTMVPSMALFVVSVETEFFERYQRFYRRIAQHATLDEIEGNQLGLVQAVFDGSRKVLLLQATLAGVVIVSAAWLFDLLGVNFSQIGIFRFGVLGVVFQLLFLYLTILLSYLDLNRAALRLHVLFLAANGILTYGCQTLGFVYYGYGYFLASVMAFLVAFFVTMRYLAALPYHTFITGNASVRTVA